MTINFSSLNLSCTDTYTQLEKLTIRLLLLGRKSLFSDHKMASAPLKLILIFLIILFAIEN